MHAISDDEGNDSPQQSGGAQVREWDEWQPDTALGADSDDADDANTRKRKSEQRVINNQPALDKKLRMILLGGGREYPWIETMVLTHESTYDNVDSHQDLAREMAFYQQAKDAMVRGIALLEEAHVPVDRPPDYFAEMVKSDEHMEFIRLKLAKQKRRLERIEEKKKEAEAKKFGKAKQRERKQEQLKAKKKDTDAVKSWQQKRRQGGGSDAELEQLLSNKKRSRSEEPEAGAAAAHKRTPKKSKKQEYKDSKFGAGARKPAGSKRNTYESARDVKFDARKNSEPFKGFNPGKKGAGKKGSGNRPGKDRRQKQQKQQQQKKKK